MTAGDRGSMTAGDLWSMTAAVPRSVAIGAVLAAAAFGVCACSAGSTGAAGVPGPASGGSGASAPTTAPATADPSAPGASPGTTGPGSAAPTAGVTSTPGLQLRGPQPLPSRVRLSPVRVRIPAIGIDSTLQHLQTKKGVLQPPTDPLQAGWWSGGPVPGEPGPAVIAGHLDSYSGPAVFIDLGSLHPGDLVDVTRSDASTAVFVVDSVRTYEKSAFPTQAVYGPTPGSALRLITCGGTFDRAKQLYLANVVVFATLRS